MSEADSVMKLALDFGCFVMLCSQVIVDLLYKPWWMVVQQDQQKCLFQLRPDAVFLGRQYTEN